MRKFNVLFPVIFVFSEAIIISFVTSLMHYLTFSSWSFYNTLIVIFWIITVIYTKSYNIGRGVNYLNTIKLALKSIFILFSFIAIGNLFVDYHTFSIKSIFFRKLENVSLSSISRKICKSERRLRRKLNSAM